MGESSSSRGCMFLCMLFCGLVISWLGISNIYTGIKSLSWNTTKGNIVSTSVIEREDPDGDIIHQPYINFSYIVDTRTYTANKPYKWHKFKAGDEEDPVLVSERLLNWVYGNLEKKPVLSVPSALVVLRNRVGDCNEHATLLTALLRASDIPARICIGLVYNRGRFFYHAWTEAYLDEWISMDATMNQMPADVSHILLMRGNLDKQVEIMGLIGKIRVEVLDYEYD